MPLGSPIAVSRDWGAPPSFFLASIRSVLQRGSREVLLECLIQLWKEYLLAGTIRSSSVQDVALQSPQLAVLVLTRRHSLESFEDSSSFQAAVVAQQFLDPGPVFLEGVLPGPPVMDSFDLAGQSAKSAVLASGLFAHARFGTETP